MLDLQDSYQKLFWEESQSQIEQAEQRLLELESAVHLGTRVDKEKLNHLYRMLHSLKGSSSTMGFDGVRDIAHEMESIVSAMLKRQIEINHASISRLFDGLDIIRELHAQMIEINPISISEKLNSWKTVNAPIAFKETIDKSQYTGRYETYISLVFDHETEMKSVKAYLIVDALQSLSELLYTVPKDYEEIEDDEFGSSFEMWLSERIDESRFKDAIAHISEINRVKLEHGESLEISAPTDEGVFLEPQQGEVLTSVSEEASIKLTHKSYQAMMAQVEALAQIKENMLYYTRQLGEKFSDTTEIKALLEIYEQITAINSELGTRLMDARQLPLDTVFSKFPRMVRELAIECEKKARLEMSCSQSGIDRHLAELLIDPLTHLIRNAVDHGLEKEAERVKTNKPIVGTVKINSSCEGGKLIIEVEDDGAGIDETKVVKNAIEKGILNSEALASIAPLDLIFKPGLSTSNKISKISGRGIGLDIVKKNIEQLNGKLTVRSKIGQGTAFRIELPQDLSIFQAILFKDGHFSFGIPGHWVEEIIRTTGSLVQETYNYREMDIPVVNFKDYIMHREAATYGAERHVYLVILSVQGQLMALKVEEILGEQELVLKSIEGYTHEGGPLERLKIFRGVAMLGGGEFAYVIDPNVLIKEEV